MNKIRSLVLLTSLASTATWIQAQAPAASVVAHTQAPAAAAAKPKNWTAPAYKMQGQVLCDEIMVNHPELLSVTFQGVPPGLSKVYTMFAGSFPERIGNASEPDDVMVVELGITIVNPRWRRPNDPFKKFVMMLPLRDATGENVGLIVLAYKNDEKWGKGKGEIDFFRMSSKVRDDLQKKIPSYASLFERAKS